MNRENWSDKNTINYDEIFNKLHIFICSKCKNESRMKLSTFQNKKNWCKLCPKEPSKYKGENKLYHYLNEKYNITFQFSKPWCNRKKFDFCIKAGNILIELDGDQHFKPKPKWGGLKKQIDNDTYKMKCANENGYSCIRLLQTDVMGDKYNWREELDNNINILIQTKDVKNIYMTKTDAYRKLIDKLNNN